MSRAAPLIDIASLAPPGGLLLVIPHPDDETLGCGLALAAAADLGRRISIVLVTDGEASHPNSRTFDKKRLSRVRREELATALNILAPGCEPAIERLGLPDGSSEPDMISSSRLGELERVAREREVSSVWTTWGEDPHCDHQTAQQIGARLARVLGVALWQFPVWGRFGSFREDRAIPLYRFEPAVPAHAARKRAAIDAYRSQMSPMIADDPTAFLMPPVFVAHFASHPEIFIGG